MNLENVLAYIALSVYGLRREFSFAGDLSENTQAQYHALFWTDEFAKPSWADLRLHAPFAELWLAQHRK